jgi:hypothetical protein
VSFAVLGDNGSGRRNALAVARRMALTYRESPYGLVLLAGDVCYYGHIDDRYDAVFTRPYRPLTLTGRSAFTAVAESALHFVHVVVRGERLDARAIVPDGRVIDRFTLEHP